MTRKRAVKVPDIGDFTSVPVIEVLVGPGERVSVEQSLITLESDKATMEVPSPLAGEVVEVKVAVGSIVSEGDVILILAATDEAGPDAASTEKPLGEEAGSTAPAAAAPAESPAAPAPVAANALSATDEIMPAREAVADQSERGKAYDYDVIVLGAGPGGYTAAFRAADLGLRVGLVERYPVLGGVCLNVGCIPSKALLHTARVIDEAATMAKHGVRFAKPEIDLGALREFKDQVVAGLTGGLSGLAAKRKVEVIRGMGSFCAPHQLEVRQDDGVHKLSFAQAIIAVGSRSMELEGLPWGDPRLMDSTGALALEEIPATLLVIGGGIIGLEMACVYSALGSKVTLVELTPQLMPGADADLVKPLQTRLAQRYQNIFLATRVTRVDVSDDALVAHFEGPKAPPRQGFERILVAVGRTPNGRLIHAEAAGVQVTERGFIDVDRQMRTNVPHIFAIGDVVGQPMLAHKASHEGKVAAEVCAGYKSYFDARVIPSVAYTDPEVAWVGVTETEASQAGLAVGVGRFPHAASGRALGIGRAEGFTKLIFDRETRRIIGAGIVAPNAGDLIAECALAIEMGCEAEDISLTIHPHPTLSESIGMAAEVFAGTITDLYLPRKK